MANFHFMNPKGGLYMKKLDNLKSTRKLRATISSFACPNCACPCKYCQVTCLTVTTKEAEIANASGGYQVTSNTAAGKQAQMIG